MKAYGKKVWLIPDTFLSSVSGEGEQVSHDPPRGTNTGERAAHISLTLLYEDKPELDGYHAECGARRTHHIRLDRLLSDDGEPIQRDVPYSVLLESDEPIVVQYSRLDTSSTSMALMTTIAYAVE